MTYLEGVIINGCYIIVAQVQQLNRFGHFYIGAYQPLGTIDNKEYTYKEMQTRTQLYISNPIKTHLHIARFRWACRSQWQTVGQNI